MLAHRALIAALVAATSGYALLRTARSMLGTATGAQDGGGWTVLLIMEASCCVGAVGVALS